MKRTLLDAGLDTRLLLLIPCSTVLTVLFLVLAAMYLSADELGRTLSETFEMFTTLLFLGLMAAVLAWQWTLPPALAGWVTGRLVLRRLGIPRYPSSILSGCLAAGCGTLGMPGGWPPDPTDADYMLLALPALASGALSAAVIYRKSKLPRPSMYI
ncbi:hypothetical protein [uncultured Roseobacter sp.]|uniref:hypothetical protein n=1 Tax=uncultured Roseobacter sp. TaxID=114847 RepID=UPI002622ABB8|nr:hypothetical protein [uncultured Roseobacter sp.]